MNIENLINDKYSDQSVVLDNSFLSKNIKFISIGLFVICFILFFLIILRPHEIYFVAEILIFTSIFIILKYSNSYFFIEEDEKDKKGKFSFISVTMILSSLSICCLVFDTINIINYKSLLFITSLLSFCFISIFIYQNEAFKNKPLNRLLNLLLILICSFLFIAGALVYINCHYDSSKANIYYAKIKDKVIREDEGSYEYIFWLEPWGSVLSENRIIVKGDFYGNYNISDSIPIYFRKGILGINWYSVENNIRE
jgi:hypothetical protein